MLRAANVGRARLMVVALPTRTGGERVVRMARALYPGLRLLARVPDEAGVPENPAAGADAVVVEGLTTARDLAERAILLYEPPRPRAPERRGRDGARERSAAAAMKPTAAGDLAAGAARLPQTEWRRGWRQAEPARA